MFRWQGPVIPACTTPLEPASQTSRWLEACKNAYFGAIGACGKSQRSKYSKTNYFKAFGACEEFEIFYLYFEKKMN